MDNSLYYNATNNNSFKEDKINHEESSDDE
jgi:hypothetical protein